MTTTPSLAATSSLCAATTSQAASVSPQKTTCAEKTMTSSSLGCGSILTNKEGVIDINMHAQDCVLPRVQEEVAFKNKNDETLDILPAALKGVHEEVAESVEETIALGDTQHIQQNLQGQVSSERTRHTVAATATKDTSETRTKPVSIYHLHHRSAHKNCPNGNSSAGPLLYGREKEFELLSGAYQGTCRRQKTKLQGTSQENPTSVAYPANSQTGVQSGGGADCDGDDCNSVRSNSVFLSRDATLRPQQLIAEQAKPQRHSEQSYEEGNPTVLLPTVVLVRGASGRGKTSFVEEFGRRIIADCDGSSRTQASTIDKADTATGTASVVGQIRMISGKVDESRRHSSFAVWVQAFDDLGHQLLRQKQHNHHQQQEQHLRQSYPKADDGEDELLANLECVLRCECYVLTRLVPSFAKLVKVHQNGCRNCSCSSRRKALTTDFCRCKDETVPDDEEDIGSSESPCTTHQTDANDTNLNQSCSYVRMLHDSFQMYTEPMITLAFVSFLRVWSAFIQTKEQHPLVLFLDDLHWADPQSIRLLQTLVMEEDLKNNIMFVLAFRDQDDCGKNISDNPAVDPKLSELQGLLDSLPSPQRRLIDVPMRNLTMETVSDWIANLLGERSDSSCNSNAGRASVRDLSKLIYAQTDGSPYYVLQCLALLQRMSALTYNPTDLKWEWNIQKAQSMLHLNMCDDEFEDRTRPIRTANKVILDTRNAEGDQSKTQPEAFYAAIDKDSSLKTFVNMQIACMPELVQQLLQIAACLGQFFDLSLLKQLLQTCDSLFLMGFSHPSVLRCLAYNYGYNDGDDYPDAKDETLCTLESTYHSDGDEDDDAVADAAFMEALARAEEEGLIQQTRRQGIFRFSHDRIRETVYESLGPGKEVELIHLRIGKYIAQAFVPTRDPILDVEEPCPRYILDAADQVSRGLSALIHEQERVEVIEVILKASSIANMKADLPLMAFYLSSALSLIKERDWVSAYGLALEVYSRSCEAEYLCGNFVACQDTISCILAKAKNLDDTICARYIRMQVLGSQRLFRKAIREARHLLYDLGVSIPSANVLSLYLEYRSTRRQIALLGSDSLNNLPPMKLPHKQWAMKVMQAICLHVWDYDEDLVRLIFCKMMQVTINYGLSDQISFASAGFGSILSYTGHEKEGFHCSNFFVHHFKQEIPSPAATYVCHTSLAYLEHPFICSLGPLLSAYSISIANGDVHCASLAICAYSALYILCGLPLGPFIVEMKRYGSQLITGGENKSLIYVFDMLKAAITLSGENEKDILTCTSELFSRQISGFENKSVGNESSATDVFLNYDQAFSAYILGDILLAKKAVKSANFAKLKYHHFSNIFHSFIDGLVYLALLREGKKSRRYAHIANRIMKMFSALAGTQADNFLGMYLLLQAERGSVNKQKHIKEEYVYTDGTQVKCLYNQAISKFLQGGFLHFAAIASERAGQFMLSWKGDEFWYQYYLGHAFTLYKKWGAHFKTKLMKEQHDFISSIKGEESDDVYKIFCGEHSHLNTYCDSASTKSRMMTLRHSSTTLRSSSSSSCHYLLNL